jgi:hypothetical protein
VLCNSDFKKWSPIKQATDQSTDISTYIIAYTLRYSASFDTKSRPSESMLFRQKSISDKVD